MKEAEIDAEAEARQVLTPEIATLYSEISSAQQKFNELQASYRRLASVWLLATFSAVGYMWTNATPEGMNPLVFIGAILVLSGIGNLLLWILDVGVYQNLLRAYFIEGLSLEKSYKLPQVHHQMNNVFKGKGVAAPLSLFYAIPSSSLISTGLFLIATNLKNIESMCQLTIGLFCIALSVILFIFISRASRTKLSRRFK